MSQLSKNPSRRDVELTKQHAEALEAYLHYIASVIIPSGVSEKEVQHAMKTFKNLIELMKKGKTNVYNEEAYRRYMDIADEYTQQ